MNSVELFISTVALMIIAVEPTVKLCQKFRNHLERKRIHKKYMEDR